jgi:hypothetical protein
MTDEHRAAVIRITFKDGITKQRPSHAEIDGGRAVSYRIRYEPGFVVLTNCGHTRLSIASDLIAEIEHTEGSMGF